MWSGNAKAILAWVPPDGARKVCAHMQTNDVVTAQRPPSGTIQVLCWHGWLELPFDDPKLIGFAADFELISIP